MKMMYCRLGGPATRYLSSLLISLAYPMPPWPEWQSTPAGVYPLPWKVRDREEKSQRVKPYARCENLPFTPTRLLCKTHMIDRKSVTNTTALTSASPYPLDTATYGTETGVEILFCLPRSAVNKHHGCEPDAPFCSTHRP